uniref:Receptor kinase-like protein Xa21 n=1 Tax=Oryza brachyantha TaxID=4533 RepID=J3KWH6_ORYBR
MHPAKLASCLFPVLTTIAVIAAASSGDEASLLAFRAGLLRGGSSNASAQLAPWSWNSSTGFCSWEGVTCSRRRPTRVASLSLQSSDLAGTLSAAVGKLTFLRRLNLSSNSITGEIPASIGRLRRLERLSLNHNSFSGAFPANLTSCVSLRLGDTLPRLEMLLLTNNSFTGPIPPSLANLSSLQYLYLDYNRLDGLIPPCLGSLPALQELSLEANMLAGDLPPAMWNLSRLRVMGVGLNMLQGSIPGDIGDKLPDMRFFGLHENRFHGAIPSSLCNLSRLTDLYLADNNFTGFVPPTLGMLQSLEYLYIGSNQFVADDRKGWEFVASLANCSQLKEFVLPRNFFGGQLPRSIVNLSTTLQILDLENNSFSGTIPNDIGNLIGLTLLDLGFNPISGVIPENVGKLANLVDIALYNTGLSGLIPSTIGNITKLNRLLAFQTNLEGPIPASLGNLKNLFNLDLSANHLNGSIPREILQLPSLAWILDLSYNFLSGHLPSEVGTLVNLNKLILSGNQLSGQIPDSIGNCEVLEFLKLDKNSFERGIPKSLINLKGLSVLNLTMNKLSGRIPDAIGSMGNLQQLFLAHNNFSGPIPATLQNLTLLSELDVSFNNLQGRVPNGAVFRNLTYDSIIGNDKLCGGIPQLHLPPCPTLAVSKNKKRQLMFLKIALPTTGAILVLVSSIILILLHHRKLKQRQINQGASSVIEEQYQRVSYYALSRGSNDFSEANLLSKGRYGSVYRCTLENEGESATMAVKVFSLQTSGSSRSFEAECEALRRVRHRCLIKIITCCSSIDPQGQEFKALVFELMPNGSLDGWIHPKSSNLATNNTLSFLQRLNIAVDIFDALDYHNRCEPSIVHCDLKPSNILLAEDMRAKVGDFGISRILPKSKTEALQNSKGSIGIRGSIGYIAPEYGEGSVSRQGDIYSLGIMLLEMFTGTSPTDDMFEDSLTLHEFVAAAFPERALEIADQTIWLHETNDTNVTDASITRGIIQQCLLSVFGLGISCSKQQPRERTMLADAMSKIHAIKDEYLRSR